MPVHYEVKFGNGLSFNLSENLSVLFSHSKESIKRHIQSSSHVSASALIKKL